MTVRIGMRPEPSGVPPAVPRWSRIAHLATIVVVASAGIVLFACTAPPGSGSGSGHGHGAPAGSGATGGRSVADLVEPSTDAPDVRVDLVASSAQIALSTGQVIDAWTFGGTAPGPQITVRQGKLIEIAVYNKDVASGVTVHWHGVDVPNAMDGVAGVTQDAILPGGEFTYRFRPPRAGTFWYHTHQLSSVGVGRGLFGALVVLPAAVPGTPPATPPGTPPGAPSRVRPGAETAGVDRVLLAHTWRVKGREDVTTIGLDAGTAVTAVDPGTPVRLRLINTDSLPQRWALAGTDFAVVAIDGTDVHGPTPLRGRTLTIGAGGRYDVGFTMPAAPVAVGLLGSNSPRQVLRPPGATASPELVGGPVFDALGYGERAPVPFDMKTRYDVDEVQELETHRVFAGGVPKTWWTINGRRAPDVPMIMVKGGDVVRVHVINAGDTVHPMHLHGHRVLVLQRNGIPAGGSPWWADTVNLEPGDDAWVAFRADNPGIWMDHCHNLGHAAAGMLMHVGYAGIVTPYLVGGPNQPE